MNYYSRINSPTIYCQIKNIMEIKKILSQNLFTITNFNIIFGIITLTSQNETINLSGSSLTNFT